MQLTVIGAGPAYTNWAGSTGAAYLIRAAGSALLLDLGQGSFPRLAGELDPADLDAIVVSHLHPDHYIDLVPLRHYLRWEAPRRHVRVIAPDRLAWRLDALHEEYGWAAQALDIEPLTVGSRRVAAFDLESRRVAHTDSSFAFRVSVADGSGPGLVYSGDCGRAEDLDPLIRPGDALLCEASFGPGPIIPGPLHLDGPAVGALAARTGAGRVLLTHLLMGYDRAATVESVRAIFDGPVELVEPGYRTTIE
jgi:ribonuclease BN (tRNA processing enzyme)